MRFRSSARGLVSSAACFLLWLLPVALAASGGGEGEGKLVHVADTRHLSGLNLYVANLYNADRLQFTLLALVLTASLGLILGLVMDAIVGLIGLDLGRRQTRE